MSIDEFFHRVFHERDYNCTHFSREVWAALTGEDLAHKLGEILTAATSQRHITRSVVRSFARLSKPESPCLVIMQRPRCAPHIGVYVRGRVLHIHERGVEFQPVDVAMRCFKTVTYFK